MKQYGCIGKKLTHSFSKEIHARLADYEYELIELTEEEIPAFFAAKNFEAINVTIPYKQTVIPYLDSVSDVALRIGAVNTIVQRDGKLYGYNTDYYGMKALIRRVGVDLQGKKVLILGTGGTGKTARVVATDLGASEVLTVSRRKTEEYITYEEAASLHGDAQVIINTTPAGMYPDCGSKPMDIACFGRLEGVIDAVYNPLCTNLVLDAKARGIKAEGGLYMLVTQAVLASEIFLDRQYPADAAERIYRRIKADKENIVLTGMPGSGKSTVGKLLAQKLGRPYLDTDALIEEKTGRTTAQIISSQGEAAFRDVETEVIREISLQNGAVIATGGGAILRPENMDALRMNGKIFFLDRPVEQLVSTEDRPLSSTKEALLKRYHERYDIYIATADAVISDDSTPEAAAQLVERSFFT